MTILFRFVVSKKGVRGQILKYFAVQDLDESGIDVMSPPFLVGSLTALCWEAQQNGTVNPIVSLCNSEKFLFRLMASKKGVQSSILKQFAVQNQLIVVST